MQWLISSKEETTSHLKIYVIRIWHFYNLTQNETYNDNPFVGVWSFWSQGVVPICLKYAEWSPHSKVETQKSPIPLLPSFSKIIEKLLTGRIWNYLLSFNPITEKQYGFQSSKCTHDALCSFLESVYFGRKALEQIMEYCCRNS